MIKNIIANFIGRFWSLLSAFLFIPLYIRYLGFESYSVISFTLVIAGIMAVLDAGLTATLSREFARKDNSSEDKLNVFKTLESSYFIIIGISIFIVFSLSGAIANHWLNVKSYQPEQISLFLKIISFDIGFQLLLRFYIGGLLGLEKQVEANFYQVGWGMFRNGFVVVALLFYPSLNVFFCWQTISTIIFTFLIKLALEYKLVGKYSFNFVFRVEQKILKRIWKFAGGMLLISLIAAINTQLDKLAISKFLSLDSLGYYTLAIAVAQVLIVLANPISTALLPRFTSLYSEKRIVDASILFQRITVFVSILVFALMANMSFFSKELIFIWTGDISIAKRVATFLPIISFSMSMLSLALLPYTIAIANGYTKLNNVLGIVSLFVTLPGYWFATRIFGAIGAASVFCGVQVMTTIIYLYFINRKFLHLSIFRFIFFKSLLFPLFISLLVTYVFSIIPVFFENSRIEMLLWIGLSTFITLLASLLILVPVKTIRSLLNSRSF